jgi:hypothetical protein
MTEPKGPASRPCGSCPYRRDAPSGLWHPTEYAKLPLYDLETYDQPQAAFFCHQQDGHLCAGWVGCHDMEETLAMRLPFHGLSEEELDKTYDYVSPVPLFASGAEAALHGMRDDAEPDERSRRMNARLRNKLKDKVYE